MPDNDTTDLTGVISKVQLPSGDKYLIKDSTATSISISGTTGTSGYTLFITNPINNGDEVDY